MLTRVERYTNGKPIQAKRKFYKRSSFIWTLTALGCLILASVGYYSYSLYHAVKQVGNGNSVPITSAALWSGTDRVNILILGVDNRNNDPTPRSDTMIVASIDPVTKTAVEFSVMRDSYVHIPGHGYDKINAAFQEGGANLAIQTVSEFLQIPINFYVETDFQGFEKVVDALGGVTINVEKDMLYADDGVYDINLHQGMQLLDGQHALMYVRFRHDATSDYTRTERQRNFLKAVAFLRFCRLTSPSSSVRCAAIVLRRSSHSSTESPNFSRRSSAKASESSPRGPTVPFMFLGNPSTMESTWY
ncbi:MAG: transcriptional regulator [Bacilli bacterium]|nr:transcriptional regulator [Bacilli bacterium]